MKKIKAYVSYTERTNTRHYKNFEIVNKLPEINENYNYRYGGEKVTEINQVTLDCEQGSDEVYNYKFYEVTTVNDDGDESYSYECMPIEEE